MKCSDLEWKPRPTRQAANGALKVTIDIVRKTDGMIVESDGVNLRSRISRRRLIDTILERVEDGDANDIDAALLALIPQAEAAAVTSQQASDSVDLPFHEPKPWPDPVSGRELLGIVSALLQQYVVMPLHSRLAIAAWVLAAWCASAWDRFPHLCICSPVKRCGKTRLLSVLEQICPRPLNAANVSGPALYRAVELFRPTLLIDEAQWLTRRQSEGSEVLRELLCAGVEQNATVLRIGGPDKDSLQQFHVYSPKVLALIGELDDVLADRCIVAEMKRKLPRDNVRPWRSRSVAAEAGLLASKLARWAEDNEDELREVYDNLEPFDLGNDRAGEMWLPLVAVVSVADRSRLPELERAAHSLTSKDSGKESTAIQLLVAIREAFEEASDEFLRTDNLLASLHDRESEPWAEWGRQKKPMTPHALAAQLRRFEIRPKHARDGNGYARNDFLEVWERYLTRQREDSNLHIFTERHNSQVSEDLAREGLHKPIADENQKLHVEGDFR